MFSRRHRGLCPKIEVTLLWAEYCGEYLAVTKTVKEAGNGMRAQYLPAELTLKIMKIWIITFVLNSS